MRFSWFLLAVLLAVSGCVPREEGKTRIRFAFWGSLEQQKIEESIVSAFEKANPDIEVEMVPIGASRYAEKVQAMMVGQIAPDVIMVEMSQYLEWAARGALLDLTDDVREVSEGRELMPVPAKAFAYGDRFYAYPVNCSGYAMYYNRDALKKAGIDPVELRTWDDVCRLAPKLARRGGNADAPTDYAFLTPPPMIFFWAYGGEIFDDSSRPTKVTVQSPEAAASIELLRKIRVAGYAVPPDVSSDQGTYQLFRDGKVALYFDGRWRTPDFAGKTDFSWDVMPMPAGPSHRVTQHGGTGIAISKDSRQEEAARRFARFYASPEGQRLASVGGRNVPVFRDEAFSPEFLAMRPPENIIVFPETMEKGESRFVAYCAGASQVRDIFGSRIEQALSQPELPAEEVLRGMSRDLHRWLKRQYQKGLL